MDMDRLIRAARDHCEQAGLTEAGFTVRHDGGPPAAS
jgi:hypothetical protein